MLRPLIVGTALTLVLYQPAFARPVSYPTAWTLIEETNRQNTSLWGHYTLTPKWSLGVRNELDRQQDFIFSGVHATYLAKRWFGENYQANLYGFIGLGLAAAIDDNQAENNVSGFIGALADWETRLWFTQYKIRLFKAGDVGDAFVQSARIGWAPYEGDTGDLHTWLMMEVDHRPKNNEEIGVTPLIRFFKGSALFEVGWSVTDNQPLVNFTYRF